MNTMTEREFWQNVYIAAIRAGSETYAEDIADRAVRCHRERTGDRTTLTAVIKLPEDSLSPSDGIRDSESLDEVMSEDAGC